MSFKVRPLGGAEFDNLMQLLKCERMSEDCRCLNHRVEPSEVELGALAEQKMKRLTEQRKVHGLLLFENDKPIAWCGVEPVPSLVGHDVFEALLNHELDYQMQDSDWAIHCLYIRAEMRGKNITSQLIDEAVKYSTDRGGKRLLAFATPDEKYKELGVNMRFSGSVRHFEGKSFQILGPLGSSYTLMIKALATSERRFKLV